MNKHTQDVDDWLEDVEPHRRRTVKRGLNKAYLSQVLEALGDDDKDVRGTSQNPNNPNYHTKRTKYRNELRQELRTKFNKLWGSE